MGREGFCEVEVQGTEACWKRHRDGSAFKHERRGERTAAGLPRGAVRSGPGAGQAGGAPAPGAREGAVGWTAARQARASRPSAPGGPFPHVPSSLSRRWGLWGSQSGWNVSALSPWALWTPRVGRFCAGCWVAPGAQWSPGVTPKNVSDTVPLPRAGAPNRPRQSIANLA